MIMINDLKVVMGILKIEDEKSGTVSTHGEIRNAYKLWSENDWGDPLEDLSSYNMVP